MKEPIELPPRMTVKELADILDKSPVETIKTLMKMGEMLNVNSEVKFNTAARVATLFGLPVKKPASKAESSAGVKTGIDKTLTEKNAQPRPPVVAILGHVDHGKTTLLDFIRGSTVAEIEKGGITQSIGAYQISRNNKKITFIDTPGHEAFTSMRARGTQVTDIVILVVAIDDGVQPQTVEAIDHAKAANVPILVALNKIDLEPSRADEVKGQLYEAGVQVEELGGNAVCVPVSAKTGEGVGDLLDSILLIAEVEEVKANPDRPGLGTVIEASMSSARGPLASVIVTAGRVRANDFMVAGLKWGRVRMMRDSSGKQIKEALPSMPVEILGLDGVALPGDQFEIMKDDKTARQLVEARRKISQKQSNHSTYSLTMSEAVRLVKSAGAKNFNIIIKTGSQGSVDAVRKAVEQLSDDSALIKIIHAGNGAVNESDVMLADASGAIIVGFETGVEAGARRKARASGITIRMYSVIYDLLTEVGKFIDGQEEDKAKDTQIGKALVQSVFPRGRNGRIAGVRVLEGEIRRGTIIKVLRDNENIFEGRVSSMRHLQNNVRSLGTNFEGGIMLVGFNGFEEGDILEAWRLVAPGE